MDIYWSFIEDNGDIADFECVSKSKMISILEIIWEGINEGERSPNTWEVEIVSFSYDDAGEKVIQSKDVIYVEYEYYHGDFLEHNTQWGL